MLGADSVKGGFFPVAREMRDSSVSVYDRHIASVWWRKSPACCIDASSISRSGGCHTNSCSRGCRSRQSA